MENKIVYKYERRGDISWKLTLELINKLYSISYPKPEGNFEALAKDAKKKSQGKWHWPCDFYYIPQEVSNIIVEDFLNAHRISRIWKDDMDFLIDILFNKGGMKEVYGPTEWSKEPLRHCEDVPTIDKIIPQEYAEKLKEILENYKETYKFGEHDYNGMTFNVFDYGPSISKENVIKAWKEAYGKDIEIPEDTAWVDEYVAEDEYYENEDIVEDEAEEEDDDTEASED